MRNAALGNACSESALYEAFLAAYREAFEHLCDAARDLAGVVVEPVRE